MSVVKTQISTTRTFGVEIEFNSGDRSRIRRSLVSRGLEAAVEGYNHITRAHWKLTTDASCGYEIVSPVLSGEQGMVCLKKAIEAMRVNHVQADMRCGLHVHVYIGDLELARVKAIMKQLIRDEVLFDKFVADHRLRNPYCQSNLGRYGSIGSKAQHDTTYGHIFDLIEGASTVGAVLQVVQGSSRYFKFSLAAYDRQGTLEFRCKESVLEYDEILAWVKMCVEYTQWASRKTAVIRAANTYGPIKKMAGRMLKKVSPDVAEYYEAKYGIGRCA